MKRSSSHTFQSNTQEFAYTLHRKSYQMHRYIRIKNGEVVVTAPYTASLKSIQRFVEEKANWISKHLSALPEPYDLTRDDATMYLLGKKYNIKTENSKTNYLSIEDGVAIFFLNEPPTHSAILQTLQKHYKKHAHSHISPRVEVWAEKMSLKPTKVSFRRAKTRWGSCSRHDSISLNTYLMMLPTELIDYIIIHELAHIKQKNHSVRFWSVVDRYMPKYKKLRKKLREYESFMV